MSTFGEILKKAEEQGATFALLEADTYAAKIIESEYTTSSNGKPQIKTRWEVIAGPKAGFKGLWNNFTLTVDNPQAIAIFYRQMTALGITNEFLATLADTTPEVAMKQIASALQNKAANVKVKVDTEWNNNKIERINPLPPEFSVTNAPGAASPFPGTSPAPVIPPAQPGPAPAPAQVAPTAPVAPPQPAENSAPVPAPETSEALPPPPF